MIDINFGGSNTNQHPAIGYERLIGATHHICCISEASEFFLTVLYKLRPCRRHIYRGCLMTIADLPLAGEAGYANLLDMKFLIIFGE